MRVGFGTEAAPQPGEPSAQAPFTPPPVAELANLFPQLQILELVGRGGMGAVYRARQPRLQRQVALKVLPPQATQKPGFAERFTREAQALARLNHPGIIAVHEFGEAGGMAYFVMEFVEGVTLRRMVQQHRLGPREALQIVPQICEALQYAHDEGVVHRDIKPENILIDRKGKVKIADFGIAKILVGDQVQQSLTQDQVLGTPHYMAPEQHRNEFEVVVVCFGLRGPLAPELERQGVRVISRGVGTPKLARSWLVRRCRTIAYTLRLVPWIGRTLNAEEVDIAHFFLPHSYGYGMLACIFMRPAPRQ